MKENRKINVLITVKQDGWYVAAGNPRPTRTAAASAATKEANDYVEKRAVAAGTASSGVAGNVASKVVEDDKKRKP